MHIKDNNNSPNGKFHRFLFSFSSKFPDLNFAPFVLYIYSCYETRSVLGSRTVNTRKFKLLYFRNETCFGAENLYKDLFSLYLQPSVNKNSKNLAFLTLQSDDVTVKTINRE